MSKLKQFFSEKVIPNIDKLTNARYVRIIMDSFMGVSALTIGGSIFMLIRSLPLGDWYTNFLTDTGLVDILNFPVMITSDLISLYLVIALGYFTAKEFGKNPFSGAMISLGALLLLTPFETTATLLDASGNEVSEIIGSVLPVSSFGATGLFLAMFAGIIGARIYVWCLDKNIKIKMPASVPPNVSNMFETMIPAGLVFIVFMLVRTGLSYTSFKTAQNLIYTLLQQPLTNVGGGFWGFVVYTLVGHVLWMFGVHGTMVTYAAMAPVYNAMTLANLSAFAAGNPCPYPEWNFLCYTLIGGVGSTLALNLLMVARGKSQHFKTLGKLAFVTSLFNINEPLMFGTPIMMNINLAVPFIACPMVNLFLSSIVTRIGLVALPTGAAINSFMPFGFFQALNNASITGLIWGVVLVAIDLVIYYPFFKRQDSINLKNEQQELA
ncbi:PTS transporter subunit EIIC [Thomasclavelia sp.]|uniref:PTS sugar transporter subunit IIC n=1 Tax=Thomasclavelia sp. TaxID=3025757 RepID=UPI0025D23B49|nr:PTS transporter subunit EIIC [Thomasclavelia sp.]